MIASRRCWPALVLVLSVVLAGCKGAAATPVDPSANLAELGDVPRFSGQVDDQVAVAGKPFRLDLPHAAGGSGSLHYTLTPDVPGLDFDADERVLDGIPQMAGEFEMEYRVVDSDPDSTPEDSDLLEFRIVVEEQGSSGSGGGTSENGTDSGTDSVAVSFAAPAYHVSAGGKVAVTVLLSRPATRVVAIPLVSDDTTGNSMLPASASFDIGDTEATVKFVTREAPGATTDRVVRISFGGLPEGVIQGAENAGTLVTIHPSTDVEILGSDPRAGVGSVSGPVGSVVVSLHRFRFPSEGCFAVNMVQFGYLQDGELFDEEGQRVPPFEYGKRADGRGFRWEGNVESGTHRLQISTTIEGDAVHNYFFAYSFDSAACS